ncbi:hypothetical protein ASE66_09210 [Bosea sp. Root483D1]|nr:hypothetical protein ASE66_09210 [Bosea sp. Root483D1]
MGEHFALMVGNRELVAGMAKTLRQRERRHAHGFDVASGPAREIRQKRGLRGAMDQGISQVEYLLNRRGHLGFGLDQAMAYDLVLRVRSRPVAAHFGDYLPPMVMVFLPEIGIFFFRGEGLGCQKEVEICNTTDRESAARKGIEYIPPDDAVAGNDAALTCDLCLGHDRGDFERQTVSSRSRVPNLPANMERAEADRDTPYMVRYIFKQEIDGLSPEETSFVFLAGQGVKFPEHLAC